MPDINKTLTVPGILDEKAKLKALHDILHKMPSISVQKLTNFFNDISAIRNKIDPQKAGSVQQTLNKGFKSVTDAISLLTNTINEKLVASVTSAASQDTQLTEALGSGQTATDAFVGQGTSTVATASDESLLVQAISGTTEAIKEGFAESVETAKQTSADQVKAQTVQTQAFIANNEERKRAEARNNLLGDQSKKAQVGNEKPGVTKIEAPKFPINGKQFMAGLGKILKGILNPVALIAGVFMHLLPYILIGIAFFKGFWTTLAKPIKDKITEVAKTIIFYAGLAFLLFKGPALLIKTLQFLWYNLKVGALIAKWGLEVSFNSIRMLFLGQEHSMKLSETMFERVCTLIEHLANKALIAFKAVLAVAEYFLIAAAVVVIVAAIVLLVGGIILLFVLFGDKIVEGIKKIIEVFSMIGGMIYDFVIGYAKLIVDVFITLITGLYGGLIKAIVNGIKWLFGGSSEETKPNESTVTEVKDGVTQDAFTKAIKPITESLDNINKCIANIADIEAARIWNQAGTGFGALATSVMNLFNNSPSIIKTVNNDTMSNDVKSSYVAKLEKENDTISKDLKDNVKKIADILNSWKQEGKNPFLPQTHEVN